MPFADRYGVACGTCAICGWKVPSFVRTCLHCKRKYDLDEKKDKTWPEWALWLDRYHEKCRYYERLASKAHWLRFGMLDEKRWESKIWHPRTYHSTAEQERMAQWLLVMLPEKQRKVIELCIMQDYNYTDAGKEMGYSRVWVKVLMNRGLELLRRKVGIT